VKSDESVIYLGNNTCVSVLSVMCITVLCFEIQYYLFFVCISPLKNLFFAIYQVIAHYHVSYFICDDLTNYELEFHE